MKEWVWSRPLEALTRVPSLFRCLVTDLNGAVQSPVSQDADGGRAGGDVPLSHQLQAFYRKENGILKSHSRVIMRSAQRTRPNENLTALLKLETDSGKSHRAPGIILGHQDPELCEKWPQTV